MRWGGETLLIDPNTSARCTISRRSLEPAIDLRALGPVAAALISHAHYDHLDLPTLGRIEQLARIVVPKGSEEYVSHLSSSGVSGASIWGLDVGQSLQVGVVEVIAVPAQHNGSRYHPFGSSHLAVGYVLRHGGEAIYYAGDTGFGPHFEDIAARYGPRLAILPIGAFAPRFPLGHYHLSPEDAVVAAKVLGAAVVVPCHFGTFRLSLDAPDSALPRFARAAAAAHQRWVMPVLLRADGSLVDPERIAHS
jgi:L-ascorbate metabolism protein UlaG (beta-lactamase superfamily)